MIGGKGEKFTNKHAYPWLGAGIFCLLLACLVVFLRSPSGLADVSPGPSEGFWQAQAQIARSRVETDPTSIDSLFMLATAQAMLGQVEESMASFETLVDLGADTNYAQVIIDRYGGKDEYREDLLIQSFLAFAYYVDKDFRGSVTAFDAVIRLDPKNPWPLNYQGFSLYECDEIDRAVATLQKSVRLEPSNQYSHMLLGLAYYEQGHLFKALAEFAKSPGAIKKVFR